MERGQIYKLLWRLMSFNSHLVGEEFVNLALQQTEEVAAQFMFRKMYEQVSTTQSIVFIQF